MANLAGFNANEVQPHAEFEVLPEGKYLAVITETQMKPTKNGSGGYLEIAFQVVDGPFKGRNLWSRLCLEHANQQTVQIARGQLSAICRAVGVLQPKDSVDLHHLPLLISVKVKKREDTGELTNEVKGYAKKESAQAPAAAAPGSKAPWLRR